MSSAMSGMQKLVRAVLEDIGGGRDLDRLEAIRRVMADYREMPGLSVTLAQGCRLWNLRPDVCGSVLDQLIEQGHLSRSGDRYSLPGHAG